MPITKPRSSTGHVLLPASNANQSHVLIPVVTTHNLVSWTFGRGTVIWRIWPAVLLHTAFAAAIVSISLRTGIHLGIPNVMLTVCGVVIGFVISYRASSGYDRYWQGRSAWSELARTSRTLSRLIWIHVPLKIAPAPLDTDGKTPDIDVLVAKRVMAEKRIALDLIEGFVIAVKHHLRGEIGIYYEDLYSLVKPLHKHAHHPHINTKPNGERVIHDSDTISSPHHFHPEAPPVDLDLPNADVAIPPSLSHMCASTSCTLASLPQRQSRSRSNSFRDPVVPRINAYGSISTLPPPLKHSSSSSSSLSSVSSDSEERRPLLPGAVLVKKGVFGSVSADLIPFGTFLHGIGRALWWRRGIDAPTTAEADVEHAPADLAEDDQGEIQRRWGSGSAASPMATSTNGFNNRTKYAQVTIHETSDRLGMSHSKHRPRIAGGGENLPLEILRSLSVWLSVLDERGVVPGSALGGMFGCLAAFEDSLSTLERILTTPLPFVYSAHIRTVWLYLFFLPFQLVDLFSWYAIPGVGIAAFIYLGLVAAGEEIEQPFGYDENDLDLDFFCRAIVHADIERIKRMSCPNVYLSSHHSTSAYTSVPTSGSVPGVHTIRSAHEIATDSGTRIDTVFGVHGVAF